MTVLLYVATTGIEKRGSRKYWMRAGHMKWMLRVVNTVKHEVYSKEGRGREENISLTLYRNSRDSAESDKSVASVTRFRRQRGKYREGPHRGTSVGASQFWTPTPRKCNSGTNSSSFRVFSASSWILSFSSWFLLILYASSCLKWLHSGYKFSSSAFGFSSSPSSLVRGSLYTIYDAYKDTTMIYRNF